MRTGLRIRTAKSHGFGYIRALFESEDNVAILIRNRSTGRTVQRIAGLESVASPTFQSWLAHQKRGGSDVYVGMNPIKTALSAGPKDDIKTIRHVYSILTGMRSGLSKRSGIHTTFLRPTSSSTPLPRKHQVVWKVSGMTVDEAESLLHGLANQFGGDFAATDATRVLRLPGFANQKLPDEFIVQARQESDSIHQARDFAIHDGLSGNSPGFRGHAYPRAHCPRSQKSVRTRLGIRQTRARTRRRSRSSDQPNR